jgi:hypothetical protein
MEIIWIEARSNRASHTADRHMGDQLPCSEIPDSRFRNYKKQEYHAFSRRLCDIARSTHLTDRATRQRTAIKSLFLVHKGQPNLSQKAVVGGRMQMADGRIV